MKTRIPILAGNWKMHLTIAEATALAGELRAGCSGISGREVLIAPVFTALAAVAASLAGSPIRVAAQDSHWEEKGAFTGEVSGSLLKDAGCTAVINRPQRAAPALRETDEQVNRKTLAALRNGLLPIVCVGETLAERESGAVEQVIGRQVRGALAGLAPNRPPRWPSRTSRCGRSGPGARPPRPRRTRSTASSAACFRCSLALPYLAGSASSTGQRKARQRRRTDARARARRRARGGGGNAGCVLPAHRELPGLRNPGQATERERTDNHVYADDHYSRGGELRAHPHRAAADRQGRRDGRRLRRGLQPDDLRQPRRCDLPLQDHDGCGGDVHADLALAGDHDEEPHRFGHPRYGAPRRRALCTAGRPRSACRPRPPAAPEAPAAK